MLTVNQAWVSSYEVCVGNLTNCRDLLDVTDKMELLDARVQRYGNPPRMLLVCSIDLFE